MSQKNDASKLQKNALEWSVFAVSLLLVGATLFYLGREALTAQESPPHIALKLGQPRALQNATPPGFIVSVEATNKGWQTAEGVQIEVEMQRGEEKQTANFEVAFLPRHSSREGWVAFKGQPENVKLSARVLGYEIP
jgi:uncharacterized protein (TIGR02588 family)